MSTILAKIYKLIYSFFVSEPTREMTNDVSQCDNFEELGSRIIRENLCYEYRKSLHERILAKKYEKRFLVTIFEREVEEEEIGVLMDFFYFYFLRLTSERLSDEEERKRLVRKFSHEPYMFFMLFLMKGKRTLIGFNKMFEEGGFSKERELEEFFKYFLFVDLRFFLSYDKLETTFSCIRISNYLVKRIVNEVLDRQDFSRNIEMYEL